MLADGDQDLASHVSAFLSTGSLILNVNSSSTLLNEELGKLHNGSQAAMAGVSVGNDGTQVVDVCKLGALGLGNADALLALLAVMEELGHEQVANLVWYGSLLERKVLEVFILTSN